MNGNNEPQANPPSPKKRIMTFLTARQRLSQRAVQLKKSWILAALMAGSVPRDLDAIIPDYSSWSRKTLKPHIADLESDLCEAIERHCRKLGIVTRKGDCPTPHEFRHSLATLNIDKLGLRLTPYYIQGRLRHSDLGTTLKIYVQNNPLLARQNHIENVQGGRERTGSFSPNAPDGIELPAGDAKPNDISMPEAEAMRIVRPLGIVAQSLRQWTETKGVSETKNNQALYSRSFILDLSKNWLPKQKVMKQLNFGVSRWHMWKKTRGIKPVVIGRKSFVRASDVFNELKK